MEREKLTAVAFAESIGVAQATISHILGPRNKYPSMEVILRLHERYNDINLEWLLTGKGNMSHEAPSSEKEDYDSEQAYPLFAENKKDSLQGISSPENRKDIALDRGLNKYKETVLQDITPQNKPLRKITEIRIFFDDNTYEIFKSEN